ncbi:MAG: glycosyltransferase family 4 protein [Mycobacteriaceae bacterium]
MTGRRRQNGQDIGRGVGDQDAPPHVLVIVQNLPVPLDRRVWLECLALISAGYEVSVICPKGPGDRSYEKLEGVHVHKYRPAPEAHGLAGYALEFGYCWIRTALLSAVVNHRARISVLQACNPPDTYWLLALLWRAASRGRVRFLFDHHDLNPEVFVSRFGEPSGPRGRLLLRTLLWLEHRTFRAADHVVSTNESYRAVATGRGGVPRERTTVVRSGPDTARMRPVCSDPTHRPSSGHLAVWLGIMGPQDGVDVVLRALQHYVHDLGRRDLHIALLGFGDSMVSLQELSQRLGVAEHVTFTGRVDLTQLTAWLSSADLALCPDPHNPLNDVSTMNKTMEYMSFALPVVASDLAETRVSAGDAALYVAPGDHVALARAMALLVDDPAERERLGVAARHRAVSVLDWRPQALAYVSAFDRLTGWAGVALSEPLRDPAKRNDRRCPASPALGAIAPLGALVDLRLDAELAEFARTRKVSRRPLPTPVA